MGSLISKHRKKRSNPSKPETPKPKSPDLPDWAKELYFPRGHLELDETLGEGRYGLVFKAKAQINEAGHQSVAVKTFQEGQEDDELKREGELMAGLNFHHNIVNLLAVSMDLPEHNHRILLVLELCSRGSLDKILQKKMEEMRNDPELVETEDFNMKLMVTWAYQIARGMKHLTSHSIIHGDLAARNILVDEEGTAKIADFGHSHKGPYDNIPLDVEGVQPVYWMAPEAIKGQQVTMESDVWSYGVILWEIFSMGEMPYPNQSDPSNLLANLSDGYRMPMPDRCPEDIYNKVILASWNINPYERPSWDELIEILRRISDGEYLHRYSMIRKRRRDTFSKIRNMTQNRQYEEKDSYISFDSNKSQEKDKLVSSFSAETVPHSNNKISQNSTSSLSLQKELIKLMKNPVTGFSVGPENDEDIFSWEVLILGPPNTLYEGGIFKGILTFNDLYPVKPPTLKFNTDIWHPNIGKDGQVCLAILNDHGNDEVGYERWLPDYTVETILISVISLLADPNPDSPVNGDAARELTENYSDFKESVNRCVRNSQDSQEEGKLQ